jgi:hypothetical protein
MDIIYRRTRISSLIITLTLGFGLILIFLTFLDGCPIFDASSLATLPEPDPTTYRRVGEAFFNLPLRFIANAGQTNLAARFIVKGVGHAIFFTEEEVVFSAMQEVEEKSMCSVVRLRFLGANPHPIVEGLALMPGVANFFLGNDPAKWRVNVPTYGAVAYRNLYPGIDLIFRDTEGHLKSEFLLVPGADPTVIQMAYSGMEALHLREDGALVLQTPLGELIEETPLIYQEMNGVRQAISGSYTLQGEGRVGFQVTTYDPTLPLVIDPELAYSTYLGGSSNDYGRDIAVDSAGNVYVTGNTWSGDFPTRNAMDTILGGSQDVFVTQIVSANGVYTYGYSTYLGGTGSDEGSGIAVDSAGNAYVTGETRSGDFPIRNAIDTALGGDTDAFVTQIISTSGVYTLAYSTYLGGSSPDWGNDIIVDSVGNVYVTGDTLSTDFPTRNAIQTDQSGVDVFITQIISASGVYTYGYSTYLGGDNEDRGFAIAVDGAGEVYVTGFTHSGDFPVYNAMDATLGGNADVFVTRIISASGVYTYGYSTYLGGGGGDVGYAIAVGGVGNTYVTGETSSSDFPTRNSIRTYQGGTDAFVTQIISANGVYTCGLSTYLGGSNPDSGWGIAVDSVGNIYVTGETSSNDFPTRNAIQPSFEGSRDAFVTQIISASGVYTYGYSTYLGGSSIDWSYGIALDSGGNAYVTGDTSSSDFPTRNAIQANQGAVGYNDAFVAKITSLTDTGPPEIVTTAPVNGSVEVAITAPVVIIFSEAISTSTFAYTITPDPGDGTASWSSDGTVVTLTHAPFAHWKTYTITIIAANDLADNFLSSAPHIWHFTTVPYRVYLPAVLRQV